MQNFESNGSKLALAYVKNVKCRAKMWKMLWAHASHKTLRDLKLCNML